MRSPDAHAEALKNADNVTFEGYDPRAAIRAIDGCHEQIRRGIGQKIRYRFLVAEHLVFDIRAWLLLGLVYVLGMSATVPISAALGGPYWLWGGVILAFNLATLYGAYRLVRRRLAQTA